MSDQTKNVFASSVKLKSCLIQGTTSNDPFDATQGVVRFDYFEDIEAPTIFASLVIGEESMNSMISDIPLQGGERVEIKLKTAVDDKEHTYQFVIYKIYSRYVTDRFQTYTLGLISEEALTNEMVRMGVILKGLPNDIVVNMLKENIGTRFWIRQTAGENASMIILNSILVNHLTNLSIASSIAHPNADRILSITFLILLRILPSFLTLL